MKKMNCQQFQEVLPYIIESGGKPDEEDHLKTCTACSALVQDLLYIAEQAKLLLPMHDPNPKVWNNIEQSLQREGLLPEGRMSRQGHISNFQTETKSGTTLGWALALTAAVIFAALLVTYKPHQLPQSRLSAQNSSTDSVQMDGDDQQLIAQVPDPDARSAYETSLREANAYIEDAQAEARRDPDDPAAQELLQDAYQQKQMLYQMAVARSLP
jgi:hypothetical protein